MIDQLLFFFRSNGVANFSGQMLRRWKDNSSSIFQRIIENGTLADFSVNKSSLKAIEHKHGNSSTLIKLCSKQDFHICKGKLGYLAAI